MVDFWQIEIQNRILTGPLIGFSIYLRDEDEEVGEWILYLGLISLHVKYW